MVMPMVMFVATLLMQTVYDYVCGHVHAYIALADLVRLCLRSCLWPHKTFNFVRIQDN